MDSKEAGKKICEKVGGEMKTKYRLRDWLISRQRYWGPPIPIIYCDKCWENLTEDEKKNMREGINYTEIDGKKYVIHSVPEKDLPVKLPYVKDFRPTGTEKSPLATVSEFYETTCPKCNAEVKRETDVSDTFLDSAWYYFRYINKEFSDKPFTKERNKKWLPVDMYIGGAEHSVLHLLYTRFVTKAFYDWKLIDFDEPVTKFRAHGLLIKEGAKMSKSKGNIINPDEYIEKYGADVLRTYLMFLAPFEEGGDFRDSGIKGITKFLNKIWNKFKNLNFVENDDCEKITHKTIKKVTEDIEDLKYNTAISALMTMLNEIEDKEISKTTSDSFLKLLAPFAPHLTDELWEITGNKKSIHKSNWPLFNKDLIKEDGFDLIIQINGKLRDTVKVKKGITEKEAKELALGLEKIKKYLNNDNIKKIIFVKDKLLNFVI
jgi:leucyl-tRNA synthetase